MPVIIFTVPDDKVGRILTAFEITHPIPTDPESGTPSFTRVQWVKECIKRYVINTVKRHDKLVARNTVVEDNSLIYD